MTEYRKKLKAKATVGEAKGLAESLIAPIVVTVRWMTVFSVLAFIFSAISLIRSFLK